MVVVDVLFHKLRSDFESEVKFQVCKFSGFTALYKCVILTAGSFFHRGENLD